MGVHVTNSGLANFSAPKDKNSKPVAGAGNPAGGSKGCLGCAGGVVVFLVVLGIGGWIYGSSRGDDPSPRYDKYEAIAQCEARVEKLLKSPSTADYDSNATGSGTGPWKITGVVDAQNSFGATVRASYGCTVTMSGDMATTAVDYFNE